MLFYGMTSNFHGKNGGPKILLGLKGGGSENFSR